MRQIGLRAVFMRGGTSRALMLRAEDLPRERERWTPIFLALMGSPDANGRQLDGMGGGISSLSKICVIGPPSHPEADVDYTFAQIGIRDATVDYSGNCGNMSSAVGPFAVDEGLVNGAGDAAIVRIFNTNTRKLIVARFAMDGGRAAVDGDFVLPGVAGSGAPIRLEFLDPGGAATGRLLPTGNPIDRLSVDGIGEIEASLVDAANPCVFVAADALGIAGIEMPEEIEARPELLARFEAIRVAASQRMGIAPNAAAARKIPSIPKVAAIAPPRAARTLSGEELAASAANIHVRMISLGQPHRAVPLTGAMCLAVAVRIPGSLAHRLAKPGNNPSDPVRIGQPSGVTVVDAGVSRAGPAWHARQATVYRTARRLMEGVVYYRAAAVS
ncbi:PrpF family protein [bacterium]|nr:PrpF family protein [bacterium]